MKSLCLSILLMAFLSSCYNPNSLQSINDLKKISGSWESYEGVMFNESWKVINNSTLVGEGFSLNGSDTVFYERLKIHRIGDSIYYCVQFSEEQVDFLLTEASKSRWLFVNPENEFPKKIDYKLEDDTTLNVIISDMELNKKQKFYLKKVNE